MPYLFPILSSVAPLQVSGDHYFILPLDYLWLLHISEACGICISVPGLFRLPECFLVQSVCPQMTEFHSFHGKIMCHGVCTLYFFYHFLVSGYLGGFPVLSIVSPQLKWECSFFFSTRILLPLYVCPVLRTARSNSSSVSCGFIFFLFEEPSHYFL